MDTWTTLAVLLAGLLVGSGSAGAALGWLGARSRPRRRRRPGRPGRGDAGPRPAQRPDARPRPAARVVAGRVPPARLTRAAAARPASPVHRAAPAAGARALGRAPPAPGGRAGRAGRPLRLHRAGAAATTAPCAPTWSSTWSAGGRSWSTPRCRSTPISTPPRPTTEAVRDDALPRHARQLRQHVDALGSKAVLAGAARDARVRGALRAGRVVPRGRARDRPRPDRVRRGAPGRARHPDDPDRAAAHRRARLEPRGARRPGPRDPPARPRPARPARRP